MKKLMGFCFLIFTGILTNMPHQAWAFSASFDQKVSVGGQAVANFKVSVKDKNVRAESSFGTVTAIMIRNAEGSFSYIPAQKTATKIPDSLQQRNVTDDLPDFKGFLEKSAAKKLSTETIDGQACDIYQFKDPVNHEDSKAWVSQTKNFPVKIEINTPQGVTTIDFQNIQTNVNLDDTLFKVPADVKIIDLGAMKAGAPSAVEVPSMNTNQGAAPEANKKG